MSADGPNSSWPEPVIAYLTQALPRAPFNPGWTNSALTAWQFGCEALVALGQADRTDWGAEPRDVPSLPDPLPRWDDMAVVVLTVLKQRGELSYHPPAPQQTAPANAPDLPRKVPSRFVIVPIQPEGQAPLRVRPNIRPANGCGEAGVKADCLSLLEALGLVTDATWTAEAELVMWRIQPAGWGMAIETDPRFAAGLDRCIDTMPDEIVDAMEDLAEVTQDEWDQAAQKSLTDYSNMLAGLGEAGRSRRRLPTSAVIRRQIAIDLQQLDHAFADGWRLEQGWLSPAGRARSLPLFHDPLALQVRQAVMAELDLEVDWTRPQ